MLSRSAHYEITDTTEFLLVFRSICIQKQFHYQNSAFKTNICTRMDAFGFFMHRHLLCLFFRTRFSYYSNTSKINFFVRSILMSKNFSVNNSENPTALCQKHRTHPPIPSHHSKTHHMFALKIRNFILFFLLDVCGFQSTKFM